MPPTSWRIEDANGDATYIENDTDEYRRAADGVMVHTVKAANRMVAITGASPAQLLKAYSMWPPEDRGAEPRLVRPSRPQQVEVRGRTGWQVRFVDTASGGEVTYVIDAESGVAVSRFADAQSMELADPVVDEDFEPALFDWTGPAREKADRLVSPAQREDDAKTRALGAIPRPEVGWLPRTVDTRPIDGDPRTGALDLHVAGQYSSIMLRQWVTAVGEPTVGSMYDRVPPVHREVVGPWTYEIRSRDSIAQDACARIIASIVAPDPPSTSPAQIREMLDLEAAAHHEAELRESLGTGRRLDDCLDDQGELSLFIRTDFGDDAVWREVAAAAMAPGEGEDSAFSAYLTCIDNPENEGLSIPALLDRIGDRPVYYVFVADTATMTDPEHPILAVDTGPAETGHEPGRTLRVIPTQMWAIENNLSIANLDFADFADAADPDGVYRGFS
ncbi:DUF6924 domain-containing protein [Nocardia sp. NBC_00416]|uniref:DUF6924 domain-containing protein n=1 Tax=Nocardia sp. NBC_00416 TaxID=2975991 RepID=UPI002E1BF455